MQKLKSISLLLLLYVICVGCPKKVIEPSVVEISKEEELPPPTKKELPFDELYNYIPIYYWNTAVTLTRKEARAYSNLEGDEYENLKALLRKIKEFSPNKQDEFSIIFNSNPLNRFIVHEEERANSIVPDADINRKIGFGVEIKEINNRYYVSAVYPNSPAENDGTLLRGDEVVGVNSMRGLDIDEIMEALDPTNQTLFIDIKRKKQQIKQLLYSRGYETPAVFKHKVVNTKKGKTVGYLAYFEFTDLKISEKVFEKVFFDFATQTDETQQELEDLVIDLRYNGGGVLNSAKLLLDYIIPNTKSGILYQDEYNSNFSSGKAQALLPPRYTDLTKTVTYFEKKGNLNHIKNVYFLVSNETASASEVLINSLSPYLNIEIIGQRTYGKGIGFFPVYLKKITENNIDGSEYQYKLYLSSFRNKNKNGDYVSFSGINPTCSTCSINDNIKGNLGDSNEVLLAKALELIDEGVKINVNL